jgi:nitroreductase
MATISEWQVGRDDRAGRILRECLRAATAAPSIHNTQPWRFRPRADGIQVLADQSLRLGAIDPDGRELLISVGAAVLNLRVAVLAHGRTPIARLFPDPDNPDVVADIAFGRPVQPSVSAQMLARAIPRRRTNRRAFLPVSVPATILDEIASAARAEGGRLIVTDPGTREGVLSLVRLADHREAADPAYNVELCAWTGSHRGRDGIPTEAYGSWPAMQTLPLRDFGLVEPARHRLTERFESEPTIGVLYSATDTRRDWVLAGQALQRALLTATARGVSTTLMTQAMEVPSLRSLLTDPALRLVPQVIVRFGYGPPTPATPRRPVADLIDSERPSPGGPSASARRSARAVA